MPRTPQDLHRRSRDSERNCARGRDFCVSCGPADRRRDFELSGSVHSRREIAWASSFWTVLTLVASALPVKLPLGTQQAVAMAPVLAALTLGGPAVGGWVAAIGTTEVREIAGPDPLVWHTGESRRRSRSPAIAGRDDSSWHWSNLAASSRIGQFGSRLRCHDARRGSLLRSERRDWLAALLGAADWPADSDAVVSGDIRETAFNNLAMGPLGG